MISKTVLASRVLHHSGLGVLLRKTGGHRGFVVLNYHRIGNPDDCQLDRGVFSATAEVFEQQLRFLRDNCDVITPDDIEDLPGRGRGNYAIITFDDGYRDNYELALPLLKSAGLKAVFFISTGFIGGTRLSWWDEIAWMVRNSRKRFIGPTSTLPTVVSIDPDRPESAIDTLLMIYKRLPSEITSLYLEDVARETGAGRAPAELACETWMTWDMVRELRDAGMIIGGHTVNHPILATMSRANQAAEIHGCACDIEKYLGQKMELFSYPRGKPDSFNKDTFECLRDVGVKYAFSYYGGMNRIDSLEQYDVRRVAVDSDTQLEHFEAMLTLPRIFA